MTTETTKLGLLKTLAAQDDEIKTLRTQVAQYKEGHEQLQWLLENCTITLEHWDGRWSIVVNSRCPTSHDPAGIRAAIDKARKS